MAAGLGGPAARLFDQAAGALEGGRGITGGEGWMQALQAYYPASALRGEDVSALRLLGASLGASDRQEQVKHLSLCRERLAHLEGQARDQAGRYGRVWSYGGFLTGLLLVLVLF